MSCFHNIIIVFIRLTQNHCVVFLIYFEIIFLINAHLKKWCQHIDQIIFANFQKPIDDIVQFKCFVQIQIFHDFDHFFIMTVEQCINIKYVAPKMSFRSAENEAEKNLSIKNRVLFSKNVVSFLSTSFCAFLINVNIFNTSLKTWLLILIYLIKRHNFFQFATFISIVFWNFKIFVFCMIFCLQLFVWK